MAIDKKIVEILPALRMILSEEKVKVAKISNDIDTSLAQVEISIDNDVEGTIDHFKKIAAAYKSANGQFPELVNIKDVGVAVIAETPYHVDCLLKQKKKLITPS